MRAIHLGAALAGMLALLPARAETNLYEWVSAARLVVAARPERLEGRFVEIRVLRVLRGESPGQVLWVDRREANRDRVSGEQALAFEWGRTYLLLLNPSDGQSRARAPNAFVLARGVDGARPLPEEGSGAVLDAVDRLVRLQDASTSFLPWADLGRMLDDPNPVLVETALDLFLKFRQGSPELLPAARRLLEHPRASVRRSAANLSATILSRSREIDDRTGVLADLAAAARRDPAAEVRVAATGALGRLAGPEVQTLLEEIARDDPEQAVRYAAERLLYERRLEAGDH
jgi:HEAT repeat protein